MAEKIEIVFDKATGEAKIETLGFKGKSCKNAAKFLFLIRICRFCYQRCKISHRMVVDDLHWSVCQHS